MVFGTTIKNNIFRAEVHISSRVCLLSTSSYARDVHSPAYFLSDWEIQDGVFFCSGHEVTYGG